MCRGPLLALTVVLLVVGGVVALGPGDGLTLQIAAKGAPPAGARAGLSSLTRDRDRLLDGGLKAFRARLAQLREFPTAFPHFCDPDASIAREFRGGRAWPTTAFYAADGSPARTHLGGCADEADLDADIRKWALGG